jgi:hypothetical protein
MTKAELASAVGRATAPPPALILVQACRRRAAAIPTQAKARLDSLARLTLGARFSLDPALAASLRSHKGSASMATLLAALVGGALPVLVYGMNPKGADRMVVEVHAYPLVKASSPPSVKPSSVPAEHGQSMPKRRDHPGDASLIAGSDVQAAPAMQQSSGVKGTGSPAPAASAQGTDEATPESPPAHESASDEEGAGSDEESSGQQEDSQGNEQGDENGQGKANGHDEHDGLGVADSLPRRWLP